MLALQSNTEINKIKIQLSKDINRELQEILCWWMKYTVMPGKKDFFSEVSYQNNQSDKNERGLVLYARLLWTFSTVCQHNYQEAYLETANLAYEKMYSHFWDVDYGGFLWSTGVLADKKQAYGHAFALYALTAYYGLTKREDILHQIKELYAIIESKFYDCRYGGYFEAFGKDWSFVEDVRLSEKDDNEVKSMNTHLHLIEAYASLYKINPQDAVREKIIHLLQLFKTHIINNKTFHLQLFFNEQWQSTSKLISYGHDIEAAWLLQQCAETVQSAEWVDYYKYMAIEITNAASKGLDKDGGLWYEYNPVTQSLIFEKHSWPQAEALVGFYNAYQITGNLQYLSKAVNSWGFIKNHIKDKQGGEWFWGITSDYSIIKNKKAGFWKCPYHNSRACLEIIIRLKGELQENHL
ncbi:MAG: N-acyl-D-glucosamine 2-epimerase [Sphingobacteriales bacterium]|nr:MAG: N-acyl-D-glucosamine 2-epimerase [Sphingobacteriales bacterium]